MGFRFLGLAKVKSLGLRGFEVVQCWPACSFQWDFMPLM